MSLREKVYQSCIDNPRNLLDLMRSIALFIPEDHELAQSATSVIDSMEFSPPENYHIHYMKFLEDFDDDFSILEHLGIENTYWQKVISILILGGHPSSEELCKPNT
jgi:hypothetical protein